MPAAVRSAPSRGAAVRAAVGAALAAVLSVVTVPAAAPQSPAGGPADLPRFERNVYGFEVLDEDGVPYEHPFLGGLNIPRPQLADIDGDGDLDLFVQEYSNGVMLFEQTGTPAEPRWVWRTDRFHDLDVGEWYLIVDVDGDGDLDALGEQPYSLIRFWRNVGGTEEASFELVTDTLQDIGGENVFADRQNIPKLADIDCDGRLDLMLGRVEGTITRYEQDRVDDLGAPVFRKVTDRFQDIEIIGQVLGQPVGGFDVGGASGLQDGVGPTKPWTPRSAHSAGAMPQPRLGLPRSWTSGPQAGPSLPAAEARPPSLHGANTMALEDVDSDGDLDLFWGDFFEPGLLFIENTGSCANPGLRAEPLPFPLGAPIRTSGYNAPGFGDLDGDGDNDLLVGVLGGAFNPSTTLIDNLYHLEQVGPRRFEVRTSRYLSGIDVGSDSFPAFADLDGDGDLDLLLGNKIETDDPQSGGLYRFENVGTPAAPRLRLRGRLDYRGDYHYAPAFGDLDGDGDLDFLLATWSDEIALVINEGGPEAPRFVVVEPAFLTITRGRNAIPALGDVDGDGDLDLFVGESSGQLNFYRNVGGPQEPRFELVDDRFLDIDVGRRSAPALVDIDGDGDLDLVVGSEADGLWLYRNVGTTEGPGGATVPRFERDESFSVPVHPFSTPAFADIDGDGDPDLFAGGIAGGLTFFRNLGRD